MYQLADLIAPEISFGHEYYPSIKSMMGCERDIMNKYKNGFSSQRVLNQAENHEKDRQIQEKSSRSKNSL